MPNVRVLELLQDGPKPVLEQFAATDVEAVARPVGRRDQAQSGELVYVTPP
ncbi:hypothetical protein [Micromonospora sp. KC207]|uniref:hypothetical protein n=1 Tax=Micromonospora sp. KC207 TaxID=2530377 RepID=UPI001A9DC5DD|nr:hypothetical protein [Micromonospora sp. KC207]